MEKKREYSRGVTVLAVVAFFALLAAIAILASPTKDTVGHVTRTAQETNRGIHINQGCCSGYCQIGYLFGADT